MEKREKIVLECRMADTYVCVQILVRIMTGKCTVLRGGTV